MAGAGFKTWATGDVLTASDQNTYLMEQSVMVFADSSARDTAVTSPTEGMVCYLKDTDKLQKYDGSSWANLSEFTWTGSTANGLATYGTSSTVVSESTATYDGTTLELTQSGGGLKMDGLASSNANTLDDYEEGTWTAALSTGSGSITMGTNDTGAYIKIGRAVFISGTFTVASVSTPGGGLNLTGLPFTSGDVAELGERAIINVALFFTNGDMNGPVQGQVSASATQAYVDNLNGRAARQDAAAFVDAGTSINVGGWYYANA